jgi:methylmalonyl-CoA epimerase
MIGDVKPGVNSLDGQFTWLTFHHVGLLVDDIESSAKNYAEIFGQEKVSSLIEVSTQKVKVCFVKIGENGYLELVQAIDEDSAVYKLQKKKITYYHVGYMTEDIEASVAKLEQLNYKPMDFFVSEAFGGKRCVFLFSPEAHLIELIEK